MPFRRLPRLLPYAGWIPWLIGAVTAFFLLSACDPPVGRDDPGEGEGEGDAGGEGEGEGEGDGPPPPPPPPPECPSDDPPVAPGDTSLQGTPFADVVIEWPRTLELCSAWSEGAAVDAERAKKVRVVVPPQSRPSFGQRDFGGDAGLVGVRVERGVFESERFSTSACPGSDAVVGAEWLIDDAGGPDFLVLRATNRYELGAAGVIVENVALVSQGGATPGPVVYGEGFDVGWGWESAVDEVSAYLDNCAPAESDFAPLYGVIEVIVGADGAGNQAAVFRAYDTHDTFAGSFPVHWTATLLARSDAPFVYEKARDFWPHVYAAEHHNWNDTSRIDFDRDVAGYHAFFAGADRIQTQGRATRRVQLNGIDAFAPDPRTFDTVDVDLATGTETTTTWTNVGGIRRVDATAWERGLELECAGGAVEALGFLGFDNYVVQLLTCPRQAAPGYEVVGVVPVLFGADMSVLGTRFDPTSETVVDGAAAWNLTIGSASVVVRHFGQDTLIIDVDTGDGFPSSSLATPQRLERIPLDPDTLQQFRSEDGQLELDITLRRVGQGVGESTIFAALQTELRLPERRVVVDGFDALDYENTHHNWNDALTARGAGDVEIRWSVETDFDPGAPSFLVYTVSVSEDGVELVAPTEVFPVASGE